MIDKIKAQIIEFGCSLLDSGLIAGTWGNLSARIPNTSFVAITPSGMNYRLLKKEDIPIVDLNGVIREGAKKPSSELEMHLAIYRKRKDIQAIIHTHSIYATACAVAHQPIPPIVEDLVALSGGQVNVAEYAICGSKQLAINVVKALDQNYAVLLANHGAVGCGSNLNEAKIACDLIEKTAKIYLSACQLPGGAKEIAADDVKTMHDFYLNHYRQK